MKSVRIVFWTSLVFFGSFVGFVELHNMYVTPHAADLSPTLAVLAFVAAYYGAIIPAGITFYLSSHYMR